MEDEYYSKEQIEKIIHERTKGCEDGEIYNLWMQEKSKSVHLGARSKTTPNIIHSIDGELWDEEWKNEAVKRGITYHSYTSGIFNKRIDSVNYSAIFNFTEEVIKLLKAHNKSAQKYNERIANPYIEERRKLIRNE